MSSGGKKVSGNFMPKTGLLISLTGRKLTSPAQTQISDHTGSIPINSVKAWTTKQNAVESTPKNVAGDTSAEANTNAKMPSPLHLGSAILSNVSKESKTTGTITVTKPRPNAWKQDTVEIHINSHSNSVDSKSNELGNSSSQSFEKATPKLNKQDNSVQPNATTANTNNVNKKQTTSEKFTQVPNTSHSHEPLLNGRERSQRSESLEFDKHTERTASNQNTNNSTASAEKNDQSASKGEGIVTSNLPPSFPQTLTSYEIPLLVCSDFARNLGDCPLGSDCPKLHIIVIPTLSKSYDIPGLEFLPSVISLESLKKFYKPNPQQIKLDPQELKPEPQQAKPQAKIVEEAFQEAVRNVTDNLPPKQVTSKEKTTQDNFPDRKNTRYKKPRDLQSRGTNAKQNVSRTSESTTTNSGGSNSIEQKPEEDNRVQKNKTRTAKPQRRWKVVHKKNSTGSKVSSGSKSNSDEWRRESETKK